MFRTVRHVAVAMLAVSTAWAAACYAPAEDKRERFATEPWSISAAVRPPKVMLVVDRSASMTEDPVVPTRTCTVAPGNDPGLPYDPASPNPCKWNDMKEVIAHPTDGFLAQTKTLARFGLAVFPGSGADADEARFNACSPGRIEVPIAASEGANFAQLLSTLQTEITPAGGTPIQSAIEAVRSDALFMAEDEHRARFVILLTDGMPNCNLANESKCQACDRGLSSAACSGEGKCFPAGFPNTDCSGDANYCVDGDNSAAAIQSLREQGVYTFVVGFGSVTANPAARDVLNLLADAGGKPRAGSERYFQADDLAELVAFFAEMRQELQRCVFPIEQRPLDPAILRVLLRDTTNGAEVELRSEVDWHYADGELEVLGDRCTQLRAAAPDRYRLFFEYPIEP